MTLRPRIVTYFCTLFKHAGIHGAFMSFSFPTVASHDELLLSFNSLPQSIKQVFKFQVPLPDDLDRMQDANKVAALNYFGIQTAADSKAAFVEQFKNGYAMKKAHAELQEYKDELNFIQCMGFKVVTSHDEADSSLSSLFPNAENFALKKSSLERDIGLLTAFLRETNLKTRMDLWSQYLGFENYKAIEKHHGELDHVCAQHNVGNYKNLCVSTRYFDHLLRMDSSLKGLFVPTEYSMHRAVFGNATPFWTDALFHCRKHGGEFWVEAFDITPGVWSILMMERSDGRIVVYEPIGTSYAPSHSIDSHLHYWKLNVEVLARIEQIAQLRLGPAIVDMSDILDNAEVH